MRAWDRSITFTKYPPDGASVYNGPSAKNVWVSLTLLPAVRDLQNKTWLRNGTEILAGHNIDMVVNRFDVPNSCSISYDVLGYDYALETFVDGQPVTGTLYFNKRHGERIEIEERLSFVAEWSADVSVWRNEEVCRDDGDGGRTCWTERVCRHSYTAFVKDEGSVSDKKTAYFYDENFYASNFIEKSNGSMVGWFAGVFPKGGSIEFRIGNARYSAVTESYSVAESVTPYGMVEVAVASNATSVSPIGMRLKKDSIGSMMPQTEQSAIFERMNASNEVFVLVNYETNADISSCSATFSSRFSRTIRGIDCGYDSLLESEIDITVENASEMVMAKVRLYNPLNNYSFSGKDIGIVYNNSASEGKTDGDGIAEFHLNITEFGSFLTARFETDLSAPGAEFSTFIPGKKAELDLTDPILLACLFSGYYITYKKLRSGIAGRI